MMKEKISEITKSLDESGKVLGTNPFLQQDDVLSNFYRPNQQKHHAKGAKEKPEHYKIVCISLYKEDIRLLETLVKELKKRGHSKASKSQVIRCALEQIDLDKVPKVR